MLVLFASTTVACAGGAGGVPIDSLERHIAELRAEQQRRQGELQEIRTQIDAATKEQEREKCRALGARLDAEVALRKAQCIGQRASYAECLSKSDTRKTGGGLLGCLAGVGLAVATGGAAAPLTLAGCGGGYLLGAATANDCGANPVCTPDDDALRPEVLAAENLTEWPQCP